MSKPLYKLAIEGDLPKYQYLDIDTVEWITKNIPKDFLRIDISSIKRKYKDLICDLIKYLPKEDWYYDERVAKGIHGIMHALRTSVYIHILNNEMNLGLNKKLLTAIGMLHDIGRREDNSTATHGVLSEQWISKNRETLEDVYNIDDEKFILIILLSVKSHDIIYSKIGLDKYDNNQQLYINILKTADALDRYRLPKKKWWIDDKYLKIIPSTEIKAFSFYFMIYLEKEKNNLINYKELVKCFLQI